MAFVMIRRMLYPALLWLALMARPARPERRRSPGPYLAFPETKTLPKDEGSGLPIVRPHAEAQVAPLCGRGPEAGQRVTRTRASDWLISVEDFANLSSETLGSEGLGQEGMPGSGFRGEHRGLGVARHQ